MPPNAPTASAESVAAVRQLCLRTRRLRRRHVRLAAQSICAHVVCICLAQSLIPIGASAHPTRSRALSACVRVRARARALGVPALSSAGVEEEFGALRPSSGDACLPTCVIVVE